jgi:excinuclease ABC subunit A
VIDLGPEGGHQGGEVIVCGTPEEVAACSRSHTGHFLKQHLGGQMENGRKGLAGASR